MQFLVPNFLWGLLAVAIPVIIHLFNFRRTRRIRFSNVALLRQIDTSTTRFRQLRHYLIMATRMLALACLALAFAQPFLPAKNNAGLGFRGVTSLYMDNSLSMQNEADNRPLLSQAISKAEELLTAFANSPTLQLLTNDFGAAEHAVASAQQLRERMASITLTHTPRTGEAVYRRQKQLAAAYGGSQLFWFSDFQKSTIGDLSRLRPDTASRLFLVPIQSPPVQNVFVDSVSLDTPFIREMQTNAVTVKLRNTGQKSVENLNVKLYIDDTQVATQNISLPGENYGTLRFKFTVKNKGFKRGRISFEDAPLTFDNDYFFVLNAAPTIRVMHVFGSKSERYVENVFENDSLFAYRPYSLGNTDVGALEQTDLLVLEAADRLDGSLRAGVEAFVQRGGSLWVIPSAKPDISDTFWAGLGLLSLQNTPKEPPVPITEPDRKSPFFGDIFDATTQRDLLQMPSVSAAWRWQGRGETLLATRAGLPVLTASTSGQGKVYVSAAPLDGSFGDFPRHALFLPVAYKIAALSVRQGPVAYSFRSNVLTVEVPEAPKNAVFKLKKDATELIPVQRLTGRQLAIELPKANQLASNQTLDGGYYALTLNNKTVQLLAFNHDNRESQTACFAPEELKTIFAGQKNVEVLDVISDTDFVKTFREQNMGKPLWRWFVVAALLFLLAETALIRWMK